MPDPIATPDPVVPGNPEAAPTPTVTPSWRDSLPEDLKTDKSLESFKDVPSLAKSYVEAVKYQGQSIRLPQDTSKPQEWDAVYNKLGRPEKPEGYTLKAPTGTKWDEKLLGEAKGVFHKLGLNSTQAQALVELWDKNVTGMVTSAKATVEQGMEGLKKEHGEKLPQVIEACQKMVAEFCTEDEVKMIEETGRGNEPWFINMMARAYAERAEDGGHGGDHGTTETGREEALMKIASIRSDKNHPYHRGDKAALDEMDRLYRAAYSSQVVAETSVLEIN